MFKKLTALLLTFALVISAAAFTIADEEEYENGYQYENDYEENGYQDVEAISAEYDDEDAEEEEAAEETAAPDGVTVTVDGTAVVFPDAQPFIDENGRTLVPLRPIANALGIEVEWDGEARVATFYRGDELVIFTIDSDIALHQLDAESDAVEIEMTTEAVIVSDRTFAPARYLVETLGYEIDWDGATRTVIIITGDDADEESADDEDYEENDEDDDEDDEDDDEDDEDDEDDDENDEDDEDDEDDDE